MDALIRSLQQASGDVVVVATVRPFEPYGDIREYAVKMFENRGRGIGQRGKDNGLLVLLAVNDRQVWVEVGYDLEEFVTDGFAGETSRAGTWCPEFRQGDYGPGLLAGVSRIVGRIAEAAERDAAGRRPRRARAPEHRLEVGWRPYCWRCSCFSSCSTRSAGAPARRSRRRRGWNSGVGPFGGGFGGGGFGGGGGGLWRVRRRRWLRRRVWRLWRRPQRRRRRRRSRGRASRSGAMITELAMKASDCA